MGKIREAKSKPACPEGATYNSPRRKPWTGPQGLRPRLGSIALSGLRFVFFAFLFLFAASLAVAQEATMNNYRPNRPQGYGAYAGRTEPVFWNPEYDSNNAAVNRSIPYDAFPQQGPLPDPPIEEEPPIPEELSLRVPKGFLPGNEFLRSPSGLVSTLQIMIVLTVITLAPSIMIMTTSFVRIMTVLAILRQAIGTNQLPPSQVITALSLFLTLLIMMPVWQDVYKDAVLPYTERRIGLEPAFEKAQAPVRQFMTQQIMKCGNTDDIFVFLPYIRDFEMQEELTWGQVPWRALLPAFMLSELKTAFLIGFQIYLPFLVLDMVIASVMVSMGMMMLPPTIISLPFKLMLFVLMNGWNLVVVMLLETFQPYIPGIV